MIDISQNISKAEEARYFLSNAFNDLHFDEESHSYTLPDGAKLISSTTWIKRYVEEFSAYHVANKVADSTNRKLTNARKRTYAYYLNRWKQQREAATLSGSRVHEYIEYNYPDFVDAPACHQEYGAILFFNDLDDKYEVLHMELRMYLREYKKAGTADCILFNKETNKIVIADWKTNDTNLLQCYNNKKLKAPFDHLYDTDLNKYALQLSDYQNMIEMSSPYEVEDRWVIHLSSSDYNELDFSKRNKSEYYSVDLSTLPLVDQEYYKVYSVTDHSKILKEEYSK